MFKGVVLAGGRSLRFGSDKALAKVQGKPMIEYSLDIVRQYDKDPIIIGDKRRYKDFGVQVFPDIIPNKGPLGGVHTACNLFKDQELLVLTCDMPKITSEITDRLIHQYEKTHSKMVVFQNTLGKIDPFPGIYKSSLVSDIESKILQDQLSMESFIRHSHDVRFVNHDDSLRSFHNINHSK